MRIINIALLSILFSLFTQNRPLAEEISLLDPCVDYGGTPFEYRPFMNKDEEETNEDKRKQDAFIKELNRQFKEKCKVLDDPDIDYRDIARNVSPLIGFIASEFNKAMNSRYTSQVRTVEALWYPNFHSDKLAEHGSTTYIFSARANPANTAVAASFGRQSILIKNCDTNCQVLGEQLDKLANLLNYISDPFNKRFAMLKNEHDRLLVNLDAWDKYHSESRSQTWVDDLITSVKYDHNDGKLIGPPEVQYFLFHPNIVIEDVSGALDGETQQESFALEIFGMNWWNAKIPYGWSVGAIQSKRDGLDETGGALFFHIDNAYTFGYSKYNDHDGWFITVDLLKAISDKKYEYNTKLQGYRDRLDQLESRLESLREY